LYTLIIPSGGSGKRFGNVTPKQYLDLCGIPVIIRTILCFNDRSDIDELIIAADPDYFDYINDKIKQYNIVLNIKLVKSGAERFNSVANSLMSDLSNKSQYVAVQDAVRPFVSHTLISKAFSEVRKYSAVIPGIIPKDTIKIIDENDFSNRTLNRNLYRNIQTPQVFDKNLLLEAYKYILDNSIDITDEASAVECIGHKVKIIEGEEFNIKLTTKQDFAVAEWIINNQSLL
jgi:2-C-methyl-D-erythritol 4-phosphate cytidylyltransferase